LAKYILYTVVGNCSAHVGLDVMNQTTSDSSIEGHILLVCV